MSLKKLLAGEKIDFKALSVAEKILTDKLELSQYQRYKDAVEFAKILARKIKKRKSEPLSYHIKNHVVSIGEKDDLSAEEHTELEAALKLMIPWRKGPFSLFGEMIDAEWRSDQKWERLKKATGPLQGKKILDIGCNNGYYLHLMAKQKPKVVLGIDPVLPYYLQHEFLSQFHRPQNSAFGLFGVDELQHFEKVFDVIFCMGILYHHTDPIGILKKIFQALRPGGLLIVESQGVQMPGPYFLFPENRYNKMPGHWFLPSREGLENLLRRSGFQYVEPFFETKLLPSEQRKTKYAPYDTLEDGLDPKNPDLTVEGYPAPWRFYLKARRARVRR